MSPQESPKKNIIESFIEGAQAGFRISTNAMLPGIIFSFSLILMLELSGMMQYIEIIFSPVMALLGVPGVAATAILLGYVSFPGGLGVVASLAAAGTLNAEHVAILTAGIMCSGSLISYMARVLATANVKGKYYPAIMGIAVFNGILAMVIMRIII